MHICWKRELQQGRENINIWYWISNDNVYIKPPHLSVKQNWKNKICEFFIILELNEWRSVLTDDLSAVGLHFDSVWGMIMAMLFLSWSYWSAEWQFGWSDIHHSQKSLFFYTHKINGMIICQMSPFKIYVLLQKSIHNFLWTSISLGDIKINCA